TVWKRRSPGKCGPSPARIRHASRSPMLRPRRPRNRRRQIVLKIRRFPSCLSRSNLRHGRRRRRFMNFELEEDHRLLQDLVARFVREALMPLEQKVLERDAQGQGAYLSHEERDRIDARSRDMGLWGLDAPED